MLAMEVLDNMPHDRVAHDARSGAWLQTSVAQGAPAGAKHDEQGLQRPVGSGPAPGCTVKTQAKLRNKFMPHLDLHTSPCATHMTCCALAATLSYATLFQFMLH